MEEIVIRKPVVAGRFYEGDGKILQRQVQEMIDKASLSDNEDQVMALIVPHAGYVYSGEVAAAAYKQLKQDQKIDNVFLIGSSHRVAFDGASVFKRGVYQTPIGQVEVNDSVASELIDQCELIDFREEAHNTEHCLEVQLPFLEVQLGKDFKIVPIVLGTHNMEECKQLADVLRPYFKPGNLFVISTDFSHYPNYKDAITTDQHTAEVILKNDPRQLYAQLQRLKEHHPDGLVTGLCGWTSVLTLLYMTEKMPDVSFEQLMYQNSGDAVFADKSSVVGYHAIAIRKTQSVELSSVEEEAILRLVGNELNQYFGFETEPLDESLPIFSQTQMGAFVSIYKEGSLRGCIGRFESSSSLKQVIREMALAAAIRDQRFEPVQKEELAELRYEVSLLTPKKKIKSIDEIVLGRHGIYMEKGGYHGVFLPQVAVKTGWSLEEFLGHCSKDKAHMSWDGWKEADLYTFEAIIISNKNRD